MLMKTKSINCERARNICIVKTLATFGHFPSRKSEKEAWYLSPLRTETHASFKVSFALNRWYDFGIGKGGNVIDLVCLISNCSVTDALAYLSNEMPGLSKCIYKVREMENQKRQPKNKILRITTINHPSLSKYLKSRAIPIEVARIYCKEVWYECKGKEFYALGIPNHLGGWELRNCYSKSSTVPKCYSFYKNGNQHLIVLEGMFDLLSLATINPKETKAADLIILNSLSFIPKVEELFKYYSSVDLYLDRDHSGRNVTEKLILNYIICRDRSGLYEGFFDLNDKLVSGQK